MIKVLEVSKGVVLCMAYCGTWDNHRFEKLPELLFGGGGGGGHFMYVNGHTYSETLAL